MMITDQEEINCFSSACLLYLFLIHFAPEKIDMRSQLQIKLFCTQSCTKSKNGNKGSKKQNKQQQKHSNNTTCCRYLAIMDHLFSWNAQSYPETMTKSLFPLCILQILQILSQTFRGFSLPSGVCWYAVKTEESWFPCLVVEDMKFSISGYNWNHEKYLK